MRSPKPIQKAVASGGSSLSLLRVFAAVIVLIFLADQGNMALIDHDWDWHESALEGACLTAICVPLLWFLAFLPLRRALAQQREKTTQLETAHAELAFVHDAYRESESNYRDLFENSTIGIYQMSAAGELLAVNPAYVDLLGYDTRGQALQSGHADAYILPDRHRELILCAEQNGQSTRRESQVRRRDGQVIWVSENLRPSYDAAGNLRFYDGTLQDITERKLAEEADAASRAMLQSIIDNMPHYIFWKDCESVYLGCNRSFAHLVGLDTPEDVLGRSDEELFPREVAEGFRRMDRRVVETDTPDIGFIEPWGKHGARGWSEASKVPLHGPDGRVIGLLGTATDITERVRGEEQLRESEARLQHSNSVLRAQQEATLDGLLIVDENQRITSFNQRFCEMWDLPGELAAACQAGDDDPFLRHIVGQTSDKEAFVEKVVYLYDHPHECGDDEIPLRDGRTFERKSVPVVAGDGRHCGRVWYFRDITSRKRADEELQASRAMLQSIIDSIPELIFWKDTRSIYLGCNHRYAAWVGLESPVEIVGRSDHDLFPDAAHVALFRSQDRHVMETDAPDLRIVETWMVEQRQIWTETNKIPLHDAAGNVTGVLATASEITDRMRGEEQLRESEATLRRTNSMLRAQQEATLDGILILDENQRLVSFNSRYCQMWDVPAAMVASGDEATILRHVSGLLSDPDGFRARVRYLAEHPDEHAEDEIHLRDGRILERYAVPVTAEDGQNNGRVLYFRDATARKRAEENLRSSQEMLRSVMDSVPQSIFWKDVNSVYLGCNRAFAESAGLALPEEVVGKTDHELPWRCEDADRFRAFDRSVMDADMASLYVAETWQMADGRTVFAETSKVPLHDADGRVIGVLGTNEDVTERRKTQETVRSSQEMLRLVMDSVPQSIVWSDRRGKVLGCNQNFARLHGSDVSAIIGVYARELLPDPVFAERVAELDERVMASDKATLHEVVPIGPPGDIQMWTDISRIPLHDAAGDVTGLLVSFEDITGRIRAEAEMRESEAMLHWQNSLLLAQQEATLDGVLVVDENRRIVRINRRFCEIFHVPDELAAGGDDVPVLRYTVGQYVDPVACTLKIEALYANTEERSQEELPLRDGRIIERRSVPVTAQDGRSNGRVWYFRDVTEQKLSEETLRQAKDQAEAASRAKSQFLANMSHELRTPMNAVIGFSEILQDQAFGPLNPRQTKYVGNILSSGRHLLQLINDILDITKIEAGRMTLECEPLEISEAVEGVHGVVKALSMKKKIEIQIGVQDRIPRVPADAACFKQILYNLFSNAIKFTPEGGQVRLDAWCRDDALNVSITDTGIGIAPEDQARVWGEFEQVDSTFARTQQGTGLGLSLTRRLVELHGGRIWMESEGVGKGSVFQFTLPLGMSPPQDAPPGTELQAPPAVPDADPGPAEEGAPWVLLVDDDPHASELMTHCLEEVGYAVSRADDGEQALFLALLSRPSVVLLDIEMPGKDGWAVLSELKSDPRTEDIPVVMVSVDQDRTRALRLGAVDCFAKPVDRASLVQTLARLSGAAPAPRRGERGSDV